MEKLSTAKSPLSSQWNRRYFELTTQGHLYYSKRKNEKNVESIYLRGCPVALEDDRTIVIQTEERCYKLKAASHEEAQEWLECLLVYTLKQANVPRRAHSQFPTGEFGLQRFCAMCTYFPEILYIYDDEYFEDINLYNIQVCISTINMLICAV